MAIKDRVCPNCAGDDVFSKHKQDVDNFGPFWCANGCGAIDEVITGQEFCDREAWDTERRSKAAMDAGLYDDPPYGGEFLPRSHFI